MSVLIRPIITEKTAQYLERDLPQYAFEVALDAQKGDIKSEVERVYEVQVRKVRTMIINGKRRTRYSKRGVIKGKSSNFKKAIVTLKDGYDIDFYKHI